MLPIRIDVAVDERSCTYGIERIEGSLKVTSSRLIAPLALVFVVLALASCTGPAPVPEPTSPSASASQPSSPVLDSLWGKDAIFLSQFVAQNPAGADSALQNGVFILEKASSGPADFPLQPLAAQSDTLTLAIFCDNPSKYELDVVRGDVTVDRTWGAACEKDNFALYTTAPISGDRSSLKIVATVEPGTSYRLSVLEGNSQ